MNNLREFILAGHATFTVSNEVSGKHFTYRVTQPSASTPHFVSVLTGPDNQADYTFIGTIFDSTTFRHSRKSLIGRDALSVKGFEWLWRNVDHLPPSVKVDNMGNCGRCGKPLTTPESLAVGLGPTCQRLMERRAA